MFVEKDRSWILGSHPSVSFWLITFINLTGDYAADTKLRQAVAVLPWGHNLLLLNKETEAIQVEFYAQETIAKGWSRDLLLNAIKMDRYSRTQKQVKSHIFWKHPTRGWKEKIWEQEVEGIQVWGA